MSDEFEVRFTSISHGALPEPDVGGSSFGTRNSPRFRYKTGIAEFNLRIEDSFTNSGKSAIGSPNFDSYPSSSLGHKSTNLLWDHQPTDDKELPRGYVGIRQLSLGLKPHPDVQVTLGLNRYEITDAENLCMENVFSTQCKFAFLYAPIGYGGGEVAYDRVRKDDALKRLKFGAAVMHLGYGGVLMMANGMVSHQLGETQDSPTLTLHGYVGYFDNPKEDKGKSYLPGITTGEGALSRLDHGIFTGFLLYAHRNGSNMNEVGFIETGKRDAFSLGLALKPDVFQFYSTVSYLTRSETTTDPAQAPKDKTEWQTELNAGWRVANGLVLAVGHRGIFGEKNAHMGFLGIITDLRHTFPLGTDK